MTFSFILWWQNARKSCLIGVWVDRLDKLWPEIFPGSCLYHHYRDWDDLKYDLQISPIVNRICVLWEQNTTKSCLIGVWVDRSDKLWPEIFQGSCLYHLNLDWHDLKYDFKISPIVTRISILWGQNKTKSCLIGVWWTDQTNYYQTFSGQLFILS